jgi:isocitrate/isopropylmalate dehydrogenase
MVFSYGFFDEVSRDYPDIEYSSMIIDNCCMQATPVACIIS